MMVPGTRRVTLFRGAAFILAFALLAVACTGNVTLPIGPAGEASAPPPSSPEPRPTPASGPSSAEAALKKLCPPSHTSNPPPTQQQEGGTPPAVAKIEHEVESVRGLKFEHPVPVEAVTQQQMAERVRDSSKHALPRAYLERTSQAWQTIGAIPQGTDLRTALLTFLSGQVIGFYQPRSGDLVYEGTTGEPSPLQTITLAHELTHAIDDQHFDLTRVDAVENTCHDDAREAALSTIEGNAQFFAFQVARRYLSLTDIGGLVNQPAPSIAGVPPFLVSQEVFPYVAGLAFMTALDERGGTAAVNHAIQHLPTSTEQIIHPDRYPNDQPQAVNVPDLGPRLGHGWDDLDAEQIGEEWLSDLLSLRQDGSDAAREAAGWDGGIERSWTDGTHTAAVLSTVWDTQRDASEFAAGMRTWLAAGPGQSACVEQPARDAVRVLFASDAGTLAKLSSVVSSSSG
ncbi:MAG: hypothetical protein ACJ76P_08025 [Actinomycetota bacterium]